MAKVFPIAPRSTGILVTLALLAALALYVGYATRGAPFWAAAFPLLVILAVMALLGFFLYSSRRTTFTLSEAGLAVTRTLYGREVAAADLRIDEARVLDLTQDKAYCGKWRTNGLGLPDYSLGWFILRNQEKALVFVTDRRKVVYLPTRSGFSILLSTPSPEAFLQALQDIGSSGRAIAGDGN